MSQRDPRVDPRPGDVLRKGSYERTVMEIRRSFIFYRTTRKNLGLPRETAVCCYVSQLCKWAATAEVIHRAEEKE